MAFLLRSVKEAVNELQYLTTPQRIKSELENDLCKLQAHIQQVEQEKLRVQEATVREQQLHAAHQSQLYHLEQLYARYAEQQKTRTKSEALVRQVTAQVEIMAKAHVLSRPQVPVPGSQAAPPAPQGPPQAISVQALEQNHLHVRPKVRGSPKQTPKTSVHPMATALAPSELSPAQAFIKNILIERAKKSREEGKQPCDDPMHLPMIKKATEADPDLFPPQKRRGRRGHFQVLVDSIPGVCKKPGKDNNYVYWV